MDCDPYVISVTMVDSSVGAAEMDARASWCWIWRVKRSAVLSTEIWLGKGSRSL
jgi:hypothetical protein